MWWRPRCDASGNPCYKGPARGLYAKHHLPNVSPLAFEGLHLAAVSEGFFSMPGRIRQKGRYPIAVSLLTVGSHTVRDVGGDCLFILHPHAISIRERRYGELQALIWDIVRAPRCTEDPPPFPADGPTYTIAFGFRAPNHGVRVTISPTGYVSSRLLACANNTCTANGTSHRLKTISWAAVSVRKLTGALRFASLPHRVGGGKGTAKSGTAFITVNGKTVTDSRASCAFANPPKKSSPQEHRFLVLQAVLWDVTRAPGCPD